MLTKSWHIVNIAYKENFESLLDVLLGTRNIVPEQQDEFFHPDIHHLHDPFLLPDMNKAVTRIITARDNNERIVVFWDYDVDGVSSTALLVRFLSEIGCQVSYRLPHRVHDGYWLKDYFFTELSEKNVKLVITVDCGTRDIEPIRYAKSLGIDVIVTDHHAVPDVVPTEVIALINPKRKDSLYPFQSLAGSGVAFKLLHGIHLTLNPSPTGEGDQKNSSSLKEKGQGDDVLIRYIDLASLGTVADCMPILWENRTITTLWLRQMRESNSYGLRKFLEGTETVEGNADIIGFQIGPRINAAGRMDTPLTALRWLLARDDKVDTFFDELEHLNEMRKWTTEKHLEKALANVDTSSPIIIYDADDLDHGIIGLVAGKLVEMYGKPAIVLKNGHTHPLTRRKWDEVEVDNTPPHLPYNGEETNERKDASTSESANQLTSTLPPPPYKPYNLINQLTNLPTHQPTISIASCRSPEWCNMIELLESVKDLFIRFGWHRQAAGFTIEGSRIWELRSRLIEKMATLHDIHNLPKKRIDVECVLDPSMHLTLESVEIIDRFRPFGIGNRKPLFLLKDLTVKEVRKIGKDENHLSLTFSETGNIRTLAWNYADLSPSPTLQHSNIPTPGDIISIIVELDQNEWNKQKMPQLIVKEFVLE